MKISLIKGDKLINYKLPDKVEGNYWLDEYDNNGVSRNIINLEATEDGKWQIISNNDYYVVNNNKKVNSALLDEHSVLLLNHVYSSNSLLLFTYPSCDTTFKYYNCKNELNMGLFIGANNNSTITYSNPLANENNCVIKYENNNITLFNQSQNSKYGVYVNTEKVEEKRIIKNGDIIFFLGLKVILLNINGEQILAMNNNYNNAKTFMTPYTFNKKNEEIVEATKNEVDFEVYSKDDYFYRKPRFIYSIKTMDVNIDTPPGKIENENEMPAILTVGPMLTMSMTSLMTFYTTINNINQNGMTLSQAAPQLVMSGAMMLSFFLWPLVTSKFQKRVIKKKEKKRKDKYGEYIDNIKNKITAEKKVQEDAMHKSYLSLQECESVINEKQDRLWEKRVFDDDFLKVSLGTGTLPMDINLNYPEEHFTLVEDDLLNKMAEIKSYSLTLDNVPIPFSLKENYITALVGKKSLQRKEIDNIILQLISAHSYESLKIAVFTSRDKEKNWNYIKTLPHLWSNGKNLRYFAASDSEYKEVTYYLDKIYNERLENTKENDEDDGFNPSFVLIVDSYTAVRNLDLFTHIINSKKYLGFSIIILNDRISTLPDQCQTFVELETDESKISKNISNTEIQKFKIDPAIINIEKCVTNLANTPLELRDEGSGAIPKKIGFLEMYGLGKIEQFNSKTRWEENTPIMNMAALVGVGNNGEKISLDLHEKYHGPHGLIAGMTGSGKSEFIITYILSLAVNYHPDEVQFILIDYKGGGLAGAFENQTIGIKLPHLVGVITNLDKNEINRSLASIESELKRRQALFNKAREISEESTIDIYKYQEMYRNGIVDEPVSHLLIIADEFAELKQQQPEFMEQLISTARIGRSLGVHLILATQKPSGVVDAQIWSNTRFRVCLRVQEKTDSTEVIKRPDAAYLTQTGRFYLQVGFNEVFLLGQSAWAGGKYTPSENIKKNIDTAIDFVNNVGYVVKTIETKKEVVSTVNYGEELINIVKYLSNIAAEENIKTRPLWLSRIPAFILITDLIKKYNYTKSNFVINPVIGEYDVPTMQEQRILTIPFNKEGNALVYGTAGSGKENFVASMIFSSMIAYSPSEVNYYVLDFGSEALKYYENSPYVGDIVYSGDAEKIDNLFKMLQREMDTRKDLFANYNGDFLTYCKNSGKTVPNIIVVINNFEGFLESYNSYEDALNVITRESTKYGIYFVLTVNTANGVRFKLKQNFGQTFVLNQNNDDDYSTILGNVKKTYPSKGFGRGIIKTDGIYEFQTAFITEVEKIPDYVRQVNEQYKKKYSVSARKIPVLPEVVSYNDVSYGVKNIGDIALGINKEDLSPIIYDFGKDFVTAITSLDQSLFEKVLQPIVYQFINKKVFNNIIINAEDVFVDDNIKSQTNYVDSNFDGAFESTLKYITECQEKYAANGKNKDVLKDKPKINCIIIGVNSFKSKLSEENQNNFAKLFENVADLDIIDYIFVDTVDKIKKFNYDPWFKDVFNSNNGIFLGNGLGDQMLINVSKRIPEMKEDVPYNFGFVVRRGIPTYVKFVEEFK